MNEKRTKRLEFFLILALFAFFYIWFTRVHALVIFDADDWTYLVPDRKAWPIIGEWNPAKVFPEVFMPFCSTIGAYLLMPMVKDYVTVMTITHGFVVSVFLTAYIAAFCAMMKRLFRLHFPSLICTGSVFLIFHFLALRSGYEDNTYLFLCEDVNCYYNYLIPGALNAIFVMCLVKNPKVETFLQSDNHFAKGLVLLALYMAVFSNLVDSVILAVYAGSVLLLGLLKHLKGFSLKAYLKKFSFPLILFAVWFVSALFELTGGRMTTSEGVSGSLLTNLKDALFYLKEMLLSCSGLFLAVCVLTVAGAAVLWLKTKDADFGALMALWAVGIAAMTVVMTALCAMVDPVYMTRSEYLFGIFFYCLVFVLFAFGYVLEKQPKLLAILPILLCVLLSETNTRGRTFRESNMENLDPDICAQVSRSIVEQVVLADQQGQTEMELYVPKWESGDNWPHATVLMHRVAYPLHEHGLISKPIAITPVPDRNVGIYLP